MRFLDWLNKKSWILLVPLLLIFLTHLFGYYEKFPPYVQQLLNWSCLVIFIITIVAMIRRFWKSNDYMF
jgi:hypothetical protein